MTPHDTVMTVISILQNRVMAQDSMINGKAMWKSCFMPAIGEEHAIELLIELLPELEKLDN